MSNLQKRLDSFKPYLIGIRYLESMVVVDVVFKDDWTIPEDQNIKKIKGDDKLNYYMICSEVEGIGLDDLLDYVDKVIKINLEIEDKRDLLRKKISELTELFKKNTLTRLINLNFTFGEINHTPMGISGMTSTYSTSFGRSEETPVPINSYLDGNGNPIELTEDEEEIILEEERAARNIKQRPKNNVINKIELPPRVQNQNAINIETGCRCTPLEACDKCIDTKY